jgi:hypothetical protein
LSGKVTGDDLKQWMAYVEKHGSRAQIIQATLGATGLYNKAFGQKAAKAEAVVAAGAVGGGASGFVDGVLDGASPKEIAARTAAGALLGGAVGAAAKAAHVGLWGETPLNPVNPLGLGNPGMPARVLPPLNAPAGGVKAEPLATAEASEPSMRPAGTTAGIEPAPPPAAPEAPRGRITSDFSYRELRARVKEAIEGQTLRAQQIESELRVAKQLRSEGRQVHLRDENMRMRRGEGTHDIDVDGRPGDVKLNKGISRNTASNIAKGVERVGPGGSVFVVRAPTATVPFETFKDFISKFTPRLPVEIRPYDFEALPPLR